MKENPVSMTLAIATPHRPRARRIRNSRSLHGFHLSAVALLLGGSLSSAADPSGRLTVRSGNSGTTPDIVGYNIGSFPTANNTRDWWRYSGSNGARFFMSPEETELNDDIPGTGDGVTDETSFLARRGALRADPLNKNYINWDYFERRYSYG